VKCAEGHVWVDCTCPDEAVNKQETRRAIVTGVVLLVVIFGLAGIIGAFS
jgi:hypothetical protein